jgi:hypothetical protein
VCFAAEEAGEWHTMGGVGRQEGTTTRQRLSGGQCEREGGLCVGFCEVWVVLSAVVCAANGSSLSSHGGRQGQGTTTQQHLSGGQ